MKTRNALKERSFETVFRLLALTAIGFVFAPYYDSLLRVQLPAVKWLALPLPFLFLFLGYGMQALCARIGGQKRVRDTGAFEEIEKFFDPAGALIPLGGAALVGFLCARGADALLKALAEGQRGVYYDKFSMIPLFIFAIVAVTAAAGVVIWFYPFYRVLSLRTFFPIGVFFLLDFLFNALFLHIPTNFGALCLLCFVILTVFLLNQSSVIRSVDRTGTGRVTTETRRFNFGLVCALLAIMVLFLLLSSVILTGFAVLGRMILYGITLSVDPDPDRAYRSTDEKAKEFSDRVFGGDRGMMSIPSSAAQYLFGAFCLLIVLLAVGAVVWFVFKKGRAITAWIKKAFRSLIEFFQNAFHYMKNAPMNDEEEPIDYVDFSEKMDSSALGGYSRPTAVPRDYRSVLRGLSTDRERIEYAYRLLVARFGEDVKLAVSDTPNEIGSKVYARTGNESIPPITDAFVTVRYAEEELPHEKSEETLEKICTILDRYAERG